MKEAYAEEPDGGNPLDTEKGSAADRVRLFYELYLPEKASALPKIFFRYKGKEEQLLADMKEKYGGKTRAQIKQATENSSHDAHQRGIHQGEPEEGDQPEGETLEADENLNRYIAITDMMIDQFKGKEDELEEQLRKALGAGEWSKHKVNTDLTRDPEAQEGEDVRLNKMDVLMETLSGFFFEEGGAGEAKVLSVIEKWNTPEEYDVADLPEELGEVMNDAVENIKKTAPAALEEAVAAEDISGLTTEERKADDALRNFLETHGAGSIFEAVKREAYFTVSDLELIASEWPLEEMGLADSGTRKALLRAIHGKWPISGDIIVGGWKVPVHDREDVKLWDAEDRGDAMIGENEKEWQQEEQEGKGDAGTRDKTVSPEEHVRVDRFVELTDALIEDFPAGKEASLSTELKALLGSEWEQDYAIEDETWQGGKFTKEMDVIMDQLSNLFFTYADVWGKKTGAAKEEQLLERLAQLGNADKDEL